MMNQAKLGYLEYLRESKWFAGAFLMVEIAYISLAQLHNLVR